MSSWKGWCSAASSLTKHRLMPSYSASPASKPELSLGAGWVSVLCWQWEGTGDCWSRLCASALCCSPGRRKGNDSSLLSAHSVCISDSVFCPSTRGQVVFFDLCQPSVYLGIDKKKLFWEGIFKGRKDNIIVTQKPCVFVWLSAFGTYISIYNIKLWN